MTVMAARFRLIFNKAKRTIVAFGSNELPRRTLSINKVEIEPTFSGAELGGRGKCYGRYNVFYAGAISGILSLFGLEKPRLDDDEIKNNIKFALLAAERKDFQEASDILHATLSLAQNRKNKSAENYVLDVLANLYYQFDYFDRAEQVFTELMRRLTVDGMGKNDPAMIEISLKLADIYAKSGDHEKAELGFLFCIDSAKENVDASDTEDRSMSLKLKLHKHLRDDFDLEGRFSDVYALYGMVLECYAQYLITRGRCDEAEDYMNRCIELSHMIYGATKPHTVTVLNNFGVLLLDQQRFDRAEYFFAEAANRASHIDELSNQLADFYCNHAEALWHVGKREEALKRVRQAVLMADESGDEKQRRRAHDFLIAIESDKQK